MSKQKTFSSSKNATGTKSGEPCFAEAHKTSNAIKASQEVMDKGENIALTNFSKESRQNILKPQNMSSKYSRLYLKNH